MAKLRGRESKPRGWASSAEGAGRLYVPHQGDFSVHGLMPSVLSRKLHQRPRWEPVQPRRHPCRHAGPYPCRPHGSTSKMLLILGKDALWPSRGMTGHDRPPPEVMDTERTLSESTEGPVTALRQRVHHHYSHDTHRIGMT